MRKILVIFVIQNWLWKSNMGTFWHLPIHQFSKFNNFLWVYWLLGKNLSNLIPPVWKPNNPYYHTMDENLFDIYIKYIYDVLRLTLLWLGGFGSLEAPIREFSLWRSDFWRHYYIFSELLIYTGLKNHLQIIPTRIWLRKGIDLIDLFHNQLKSKKERRRGTPD